MRSYSTRVASALMTLFPSALFTTMASASSMTPFFIPWSSSPAPVMASSRKISTMSRTVTSLCPTPTVSTRMTPYPAASQSSRVSRLLRVSPPRVPPEGEGRMKAFGSRDRFSIRVLSPRMLPLVTLLLGSTARTATLCPSRQRSTPSASMKVLLPAPGTPVIPTRTAWPVRGRTPAMTCWARSKCAAALLSTSVMARESTVRSPASTPST